MDESLERFLNRYLTILVEGALKYDFRRQYFKITELNDPFRPGRPCTFCGYGGQDLTSLVAVAFHLLDLRDRWGWGALTELRVYRDDEQRGGRLYEVVFSPEMGAPETLLSGLYRYSDSWKTMEQLFSTISSLRSVPVDNRTLPLSELRRIEEALNSAVDL